VAFVVGLWIQSARARYVEHRRPHWPAGAYALLGLSAVAGVFAIIGSWAHPFSRARDTAMWLKQNYPPNAPIVGAPDVSFASVAEEMQRPVYFLECGCVDTFKLFARTREDYPETELPQRLNRAMSDLHTSELTFVLYRRFAADDLNRLAQAGFVVTPLQEFPGADAYLESYSIYRISRQPAASR
jgi:hypothetical protein